MPRYDERSGPTRLYVGHIPRRTRSRDLHDLFSKYGRVRDVDMKTDYAFIDFSDPRDADDARHYLNNRSFDGSRIVVEFAKRGPRGGGGSRDYGGRGPAPGTGRCYNCGHDGHWARDCKAGDWKNKCYRCGQRGHIERNCTSSARNRSNSRSRSRSPSGGRRRSRSHSYSPKRSYSRSPVRKNGHSDGAEKKSRSDSLSRSPRRRSRSLSPARRRTRSVSPARNGKSPKHSRSHSRSPDEQRPPRDQSASPIDNGKRAHSRSPSRSPIRESGPQDDISPAHNAQSPENSGHSNSQSAD